MSWQRGLLNWYLRRFERPALERHPPDRIRRRFELKSRLSFHPPRASRFRRDRLADVPVQWVTAKGALGRAVMLYFHGGAYVFGSSSTHRAMLAKLSALTGLPACLPDYRLAPEHPFPAQIADALACYRALSDDHPVIIGGDSAGGGLALALLAEVLRQDLPRPDAVFAFSPVTDMTFSGASITSNADRDVVLPANSIARMTELFLAGEDPRDPRASPLFANFAGAPPVWLTASDSELLLDDALRMHRALQERKVESCLRIERNHPHVWPIFHNMLPEANRTLRFLAQWILERQASLLASNR